MLLYFMTIGHSIILERLQPASIGIKQGEIKGISKTAKAFTGTIYHLQCLYSDKLVCYTYEQSQVFVEN